jgi:hypothetical protein
MHLTPFDQVDDIPFTIRPRWACCGAWAHLCGASTNDVALEVVRLRRRGVPLSGLGPAGGGHAARAGAAPGRAGDSVSGAAGVCRGRRMRMLSSAPALWSARASGWPFVPARPGLGHRAGADTASRLGARWHAPDPSPGLMAGVRPAQRGFRPVARTSSFTIISDRPHSRAPLTSMARKRQVASRPRASAAVRADRGRPGWPAAPTRGGRLPRRGRRRMRAARWYT